MTCCSSSKASLCFPPPRSISQQGPALSGKREEPNTNKRPARPLKNRRNADCSRSYAARKSIIECRRPVSDPKVGAALPCFAGGSLKMMRWLLVPSAASKRASGPFLNNGDDMMTTQKNIGQDIVLCHLNKTPSKFLLETEHWNPPKPSGARPNQQIIVL